MALSWNEIKKRSIEFSREWEDATSEKAEAKTFWDQFFNIFGLSRRRIASFEVRGEFPDSSLADLYDPIAMPPKLVKAHQELDKAVVACYSRQTITTELSRLGFLPALLCNSTGRFHLYKKYTAPMFEGKWGEEENTRKTYSSIN